MEFPLATDTSTPLATNPSPQSRAEFVRRVTVAATAIIAVVALWRLTTVLLLVLGSIIVAVILRAISEPLARRAHLPDRVAFGLSVLLCTLGTVAVAGLFGSTMAQQLNELAVRLPAGLQSVAGQLHSLGVDPDQLSVLRERLLVQQGLETVSQLFTAAAGAVGGIVIVFVGGVYLAAQPQLYVRGLLALFPPKPRTKLEPAFHKAARALRHWLVGQLATMVAVGALTGSGAAIIGLPSPAALGLIAGLLEFLPFVGPVVTVVPAVLLALPIGREAVILSILLILVVQQVEGNLLTPLIQRKAISLPPAVTLFALVAMGLLFGFPGVLLAMPLTVIAYVAVRELYLPTIAGTDVPCP